MARLGLRWAPLASRLAFRTVFPVKPRRFAGVAGIRRLVACPIARRSLNFQLVQLVPFGVSAITLGYGEQLANPAPWIKGGRSRSLCLNLNWSGVGFVLQGDPDLSRKNINYGNHCNF